METLKKFLIFQKMEFSYIFRVIKVHFLISLVLKDKNSYFFPRKTLQGFSFSAFFSGSSFTFFSLSLFTFIECFHFSSFSGVSIFHLSRVFSFLTFLRCFILLFFGVFFCCCNASVADLRELFLISGVF